MNIHVFIYCWENVLLPLLTVLAWPGTVVLGFFVFRRIIGYLFISIESCNFFGAKGSIRPIHEVIEERAKAMNEKEKRDTEYESTINRLDSKGLEASEYKRIALEILEQNKHLSAKLSELEIQRKNLEFEISKQASPVADKLQYQIDELMSQISKLKS